MKSVALVVVALGLLLAMAAPSLAHGYWAPVHHHHVYSGPYYHGGYRPVVVGPAPVVAPAPVYGYTACPPVVGPVYAPVAPCPYYYGAPGVTFGFRGRGVAVGVGL
jgi:hypothetical protein